MSRKALGVLVSGSGSNLQALIDACSVADFPARISVVVSNVPTAFALERARRAGIASEVLEHKKFGSRTEYDEALVGVLRSHGVTRVCLAGFMRLLGPGFLRAFPEGVMNVHPALLPAFPGVHGAKQALDYGAKVAGCTVHFVDEGTDTGPVIAQACVPVLPDDTEATLQARIQQEEHRLYPEAVRLWCEDRLVVQGRRVRTK